MTDILTEVRIHGRGGQGNVLAAYALATAAIDEGQWAQAFPAFGAERRGAPVAAFVRISSRPHLRRCQISEPHYLIVQDETLIHISGVLAGVRAGGGLILNSNKNSEEIAELQNIKTYTLPATQLAMTHVGRPLPNVALLTTLLCLTGLLRTDSLIKALSHRLREEELNKNRALVDAVQKLIPQPIWADAKHANTNEANTL